MKSQLFATAFIFGFVISFAAAGVQSVGVHGSINCDGEVAANIRLELWDKDRLDPDDLMANTTTGKTGNFYIKGKESEVTTIDPELRIFHKCGVETAKCYKQTIIEIPDEFITDGAEPKNFYDAGNINLRILPNTESKYCD
uniref:Transthyretin-like family protein n=1 Tax=Panagrolaimus sp. PS1159 TaxID=55785 RepID=A0AC35F9E1_9BILA